MTFRWPPLRRARAPCDLPTVPDEVHREQIGKLELSRYRPKAV